LLLLLLLLLLFIMPVVVVDRNDLDDDNFCDVDDKGMETDVNVYTHLIRSITNVIATTLPSRMLKKGRTARPTATVQRVIEFVAIPDNFTAFSCRIYYFVDCVSMLS
jgi:hypothetical protein